MGCVSDLKWGWGVDCVTNQSPSVLINFSAGLGILKSPNPLRSGLDLYIEDKFKYVWTETFQSKISRKATQLGLPMQGTVLVWVSGSYMEWSFWGPATPPSKSRGWAVRKCFFKGKEWIWTCSLWKEYSKIKTCQTQTFYKFSLMDKLKA